MAFEIQVSPLFDFEKVRLIDAETGVAIEITTKGALMNSWQVKHQHKTLNLIDGNDFGNGWSQFEQHGFKGAKMAPFACRLEDGQFEQDGKKYSIDKFYLDKHAIHGIVYDALYTIQSTQADENGAYVVLKYAYVGSDKGYPFHFNLQIKWHLQKNNKISVETLLTNHAETTIPMMDGWHPYFTMGGLINECSLVFKSKGKVIFNDQLLPTGQIMEDFSFNSPTKIGTTILDNCFLLDPSSHECIVENEQLKLIVQGGLNYPYLQLYIPPDRKSIAIENLSGAPNSFNNKMGLLIMKPHENLVFKTSYQVLIKL